MSQSDRERWDQRYAAPRRGFTKGPHAILKQYAPPAHPGSRALDVACGLGREALWLAAHGYTVDALDISLRALRQARAEMQQRGLAGVYFIAADLDHFPLPRREYDLVTVFRFLDRRLFPAIRARVRPGGMIIYQTLNIHWANEHPTTNPAHMLQPGELPGYFSGWTPIWTADDEQVSTFVGVKPEGNSP